MWNLHVRLTWDSHTMKVSYTPIYCERLVAYNLKHKIFFRLFVLELPYYFSLITFLILFIYLFFHFNRKKEKKKKDEHLKIRSSWRPHILRKIFYIILNISALDTSCVHYVVSCFFLSLSLSKRVLLGEVNSSHTKKH